MKKLRIALTGATGLLGRNLLFEIIKQNLGNLEGLEIYVFGRNLGDISIGERIKEILLTDGINYIKADREKINDFLEAGIKFVFLDLDYEKILSETGVLRKLARLPIDYFFHVASLTDFRQTHAVVKSLISTNVEGTRKLLNLLSNLTINEFCYVSSAYVCGSQKGDIKPDYINLSEQFRNPYEKTKLEAEMMVRYFCKNEKIKFKVFRPSTICGRLMEEELGAVCKFDVFYSWLAFFLRLKKKEIGGLKDIYAKPVRFNVRVCLNRWSGLNIVPADFAAKAMYQVCLQEGGCDSYHLVNRKETPHTKYLLAMLKKLNIHGVKGVRRKPKDLNRMEEFYYKTVGDIFTPYINTAPMLFNTKNLSKILKKQEIVCPPVDNRNLEILINYAQKFNFGL